jgi:hypothetical protein
MQLHRIWIDHCETARGIEDEFIALDFLIGEFWSYLEAAVTDSRFRDEIPAFAAEIKSIFNAWQLDLFLEQACRAEPIDASMFDEEDFAPDEIDEIVSEDEIQVAEDLRLIERTRKWLVDDRA